MESLKIDGPRACTKADLPEVIALVDSELGRRGTDQTMLTDYPLVYQDKNLENVRILRVNGELASVVPFVVWPVELDGCRFSFANISPTATAVPHRKKGYGRLCLEDCIRRMEAIDCDLSILRTQVATFPFYEGGDYQAVQNQGWIYRCTRDDAQKFVHHGEDIELPNRLAPDQMAAVQAMHEKEITGARRSAERCRLLFSLPKMRTLLAYRDKALVGYLVVSAARNMPGLLEAGGDPAAVETLVGRALSELPEAGFYNAHANLTDSVLRQVLEMRLSDRRQPTPENRMIRINLTTAFLRRIAPWLEKKNRGIETSFSLTAGGETISFQFDKRGLKLGSARLDRHHELSRRELVSAVFGAHSSYPPEAKRSIDGLPVYSFPVFMLDRS